jgi:hypothetical protein
MFLEAFYENIESAAGFPAESTKPFTMIDSSEIY